MAPKDQNGDHPNPLNSLWAEEEKGDARFVTDEG
jgi:hypothetical protein